MAVSSSSSLTTPFSPIPNSPNISKTPKISFVSMPSNSPKLFKLSSSSKLFAATQVLQTQQPTFEDGEADTDSEKMAPKQKIRIKLRSYWVPLIEATSKQIMDAAKNSNAKTMGPVPLPTKRRVYCVLKSPNGHKDARFHFEIRTHQRLIDILFPTAQTIDSLMQLDLPAGVDVEVKL